MKWLSKQWNDQSGFTLVEVLISIFILSIIISSASVAFVYAAKVTKDNKINMTSMNLANDAVEYIRSLEFTEVGTIGGNPEGVLEAYRLETVGGINYKIYTSINWEEEADWDALSNAEWDYKSVRVTVVPENMEGDPSYTKEIETFLSRSSTQPPLTGGNIRLRLIRGWNTVPGTIEPITNAKVSLTAGPDAPAQVQTSSKGAARFLDLSPGSYRVHLDVSDLGMILHPNHSAEWNVSVANFTTTPLETFKVEYPCQLRITLKDLEENPITMAPGDSGTITMKVPYPEDTILTKNFTAADLDAQGQLPPNFLTDLWPVGIGYSGRYEITNIILPECQYMGSFVGDITNEWDGTFVSPGTSKDIVCYLGTIPDTPVDICTSWVNGTNIVSGMGAFTAYNSEGEFMYSGKFTTSNLAQTIVMQSYTTSEFKAISLFFENTGSAYASGLLIDNRSNLILRTGTVVFRGQVEFKNAINSLNIGKITLSTTYDETSFAPSVDGSAVGGTPGVRYGKLYLAKPMVLNGDTLVEPGGYYFYDGMELPNNATGLIPIDINNK
jgi:prepilin-type N-terminal cleavage/methylation domain-containing protein